MSDWLRDEELRRLTVIPLDGDGHVVIHNVELAMLIDEVRARRLSSEDVEVLRWVRYRLVEYAPESAALVVRTKAARAVLDRLIGGEK